MVEHRAGACGRCRFYERADRFEGDGLGLCHRLPRFERREADDWCGEFERRAPERRGIEEWR